MPAAAIVGSIAGAAISSRASKKAAGAQAAAADRASAVELEKFNIAREDQAPWRDIGGQGLNRLALGLGILPEAKTRQQLREELLPSYTTPGSPGIFGGRIGGRPGTINEAGLEAAINEELASQEAPKKDPFFGSLNRQFGQSDLEADPIYQERLRVGLPEGQNNLMRMMSARGGLESGATLKALTRFNQDYASGEGTNAFNRFQTNRANILNPLQSLAGVGQTTAAQLGNQAIQTGQSIGQNTMGAGNARASGYVGSANAITGAIGNGINNWQQNELMKRMTQPVPFNNFLASNQGILNQGLSSNDLIRGF